MTEHAIVIGLGFGDEGKGATVDYLTATGNYDIVVRFNGGQQAGHNVVTPEGLHHTFTQIGSGFFNGVPSHTSGFCTFDPIAFHAEANALYALTGKNPYEVHTVSPRALLTTELHRASNALLETARGDKKHGSVGVGFGETIRYALVAGDEAPQVQDLNSPETLLRKMRLHEDWLIQEGLLTEPLPEAEHVRMLRMMTRSSEFLNFLEDENLDLKNRTAVFEGAQGTLLDEWYGFHPHTTWSTTTAKNARALLTLNGDARQGLVYGCTRTYHTRHGAGPLQGEGQFLSAPEEKHNSGDGVQGVWRNAPFSLPLFRYSLAVAQPDVLSVTHMDVVAPAFEGKDVRIPTTDWAVDEPARLEEQRIIGESTVDEQTFFKGFMDVHEFEKYVPVALVAYGPSREDRQTRS